MGRNNMSFENSFPQELVSIIVPVYNVELYLQRCVESLCGQTYKNIEVILIDDGATDSSGKLCDEFAETDSRITVIHQGNGGLSHARNVGIDAAKGGLITFVDSDDWVDNCYISSLYDNLKEYDADISGCFFQYISDNEKILQSDEIIDVKVWNSEEALRAMLQQDGYTSSAWGQLYKKELFDDIRFPKGKYYEDLATTYKLLSKANVIVHSNDRLYFYYQRAGSIQSQKYSEKHYEEFLFMRELEDYVMKFYPDIEYAAKERLVGVCFHLLLKMNKEERKTLIEAKEMDEIIKRYRRDVLKEKRTSRKVRYGCMLSVLGIDIVELFYDFFRISGKIEF